MGIKRSVFRQVIEILCAFFLTLPWQPIPAQNVDLRGNSTEPGQKQAEPSTIPTARLIAAKDAYDHATAESLAALPNNSGKLRDMYALYAMNHVDNRPNQILLTQDMKRRGEGAFEILADLFKKPVTEATRIQILRGLMFNLWIGPERFLPLVREWYAERKKNPPKESDATANSNKLGMSRFISWVGQPEDEAMLRDLVGLDGQESAEMKDFMKYAHTRISQKSVQQSLSGIAAIEAQRTQPVRVETKDSEPKSQENNFVSFWLIFAMCILSLFCVYLVLRRKRKRS